MFMTRPKGILIQGLLREQLSKIFRTTGNVRYARFQNRNMWRWISFQKGISCGINIFDKETNP